jgi:DNA polymerase-3 subunit beta
MFITKKELTGLIGKVSPTINKNSNIAILRNIKIGLNGKLTMHTTDLDVTAIASIPCIVPERENNLCINGESLKNTIKGLTGTINLTIQDQILKLTTENGINYDITGTTAEDFPCIHDIKYTRKVNLSVSLLSAILENTAFAVSKDASRTSLMGVYVRGGKNGIIAVGVDGHKLGEYKINGVWNKFTFIVPPKPIAVFVKNCVKDKPVYLYSNRNGDYIQLKQGDYTVIIKTMELPFPNYWKAIPQKNDKTCIINRIDLLNKVSSFIKISNKKTNMGKFLFTPESLKITVNNEDTGANAETSLQCIYSGDQHYIGINVAYLSEILNIIDTDMVRITMNTVTSAILIYPETEKERHVSKLFLVIPLHIK